MINLDFAFYFSIFRRRLPLFLAVAVLVGAAGMALMFVLPVVYRATAKILVESAQIPADLARSTVPTSAAEQFQIIQEDVLSRQNLLSLADRFSIYKKAHDLSQADIVDDMEARINIEPVRTDAATGGAAATVVHISFAAGDADLAANVANELVSMILLKDVDLRTSRARDTVQFFSQETARLEGELKLIDSQILDFKNNHIDALPDSIDFRRQEQSALQQRLLLLSQEEAALMRRQADLQSHRAAPAIAPSSPEEKTLQDVREALVQQLGVFAEDSPTIKALRARVATLEAQVRNGTSILATDPGDSAPLSPVEFELGGIKDRQSAIAEERAAVEKAISEVSASIAATPSNETVLNSLQRNHQNLQAQYDSAIARLAEASTGQQIELRLKGERLSLIETAVPPQSPVSPKRKVFVIGTVLAALLLGLAAVVGPELLNKRIRRPVELIDKMDIRPMITVPYIAGNRERRRGRRRVAAAVIVALGAAVPAVLFGLHAYGPPVEALVSRTIASLNAGHAGGNG